MTVKLKDILAVLDQAVLNGDPMASVVGVTHDSRKISPGWAFVALPGEKADGCDFAQNAVKNGATVVIAERPPNCSGRAASWVTISDTRKALGRVASLVYGKPTEKLTLVGITGTNGKTTLTFLLEAIVKAAGGTPGVVGTITHRWLNKEHSALHTTPEASDLQAVFAEMVRDGVTHAIIEVSSHGLHLGRLEGCNFDVGVFTNLSQDHLDYHKNMEAYFEAKAMLFHRLLPDSSKRTRRAVINMDDHFGRRLAHSLNEINVAGYGLSAAYDVHSIDVSLNAQGISTTVVTPSGRIQCRSRLTGAFNLLNVIAAVAVSEALELPHDAIARGVESVGVVPGRLERIDSDNGTVYVDYAHTPDALANVLQALRGIVDGRIITVMGCGGDRDKAKRPIMGKEAAAGSEFVVVTSDNPRSEDPLAIIDQVVGGLEEFGLSNRQDDLADDAFPSGCYRVIPNRREAIAWAVGKLRKDDVLLVAGKGHETYQEIKGVRYPFDDREVIREELRRRAMSNVRSAGG